LGVLIALMCSLDLGSTNLVFTLWVANVGYLGFNGFSYLRGFGQFGIGVLVAALLHTGINFVFSTY